MASLNTLLAAAARASERRMAEVSGNNQTAPSTSVPVEAVSEEAAPTISQYDSSQLSYTGTTRFRGGDWSAGVKTAKVTIAGAGGIGSHVAVQLARMQVEKMILVDGDKVEAVNLAGQFYGIHNIGQYKTTAVAENIKTFCVTRPIATINQYLQTKDDAVFLNPITITALDSMKARKVIWELYKEKYSNASEEEKAQLLFIDGRMSADTLQIFSFRMNEPEKIKLYEETALFSEAQAAATACSYKATYYISSMIGSVITGIVKQHYSSADNQGKWKNTNPLFIEISSEFGWKFRTSNGDWREED